VLSLAALVAVIALGDSSGLRSTARAQTDPNTIVPPSAFAELKWRSVGATRGGRVTAYSGVRQQPHTFYFGGVGGGVWKTEDAGITWEPVSDGQITTTGSIGSIDVAPSNPDHVWVGTGSAAIRSNVIIGRGVYKSLDAGKTWQFMGLKDSGQIGGIRVHPTNPDTVWLAALGSPFGPNEERGIFKTTDGGKTWKKTLFVNNETGGRDIEVDWQNPNVLYAAMYRGFRKGWDIISGGPASEGGIYKSVDGGETWKKITAGLPDDLIGKIDIDIARSNPNVLYAMVEALGPRGGLYKSTDAGESWTLVNNSQRLRARPFYFHYAHVNPKNENEVWVNELGLHKSVDGGKTFTTVRTPHGDNHGMWFNPDNPDIILQVNDGGANVSLNGGKSWSSILNQPTAEYYMVSVDEQYPYRLYMPQQDNSTIIIPSVPPVSWGFDNPTQAWEQASGCETGQIWPKPDGKVVWGACKGEVGRYNTETGQEKHYWVYPQNRYGHDPDEIKYRFPRQTVVYVSPHDERVIYQASHVLHRSTDEGILWEIISPDLTAHEPEYQIVSGNPITRDVTGEEVYSTIYSMVEARNEKGVLWVGANDGPVHVSRDNGKTWKNVTPKGLVGARIQTIEDSPHQRGRAYIAAYRFLREHDFAPYIYRTDDYGETWTLLTDGKNGIPADHATRVIREDPKQPGLLFAGTEFGFFVSFNAGRNWQPLQLNLPTTPVTDLKVHRNDLVISTMGRSAYIMDNITPLQQLAAIVAGGKAPTASQEARDASAHSVASAMERRGFSDMERRDSSDMERRGLSDMERRGFSPGVTHVPAFSMTSGRLSMAALFEQAGASKPSLPSIMLFAPRETIRMRNSTAPASPDSPEYPTTAAHLDLYFEQPPPQSATLEVLDARGQVLKTWTVLKASSNEGSDQEMRGPFRRGGGSSPGIKPQAGMQRVLWDLRYPGPWAPNAPNGGQGGPLVPPGKYTAKLTAGGQTISHAFEVKSDPRVAADGVSDGDIAEQVKFQLTVRDAVSEAAKLQQSIEQAMDKQGVKRPDAALPGTSPSTTTYAHPLQKLWARVANTPGIYTQPMLINQLNNIQRMIGQADQKIGKDAYDRFDDLLQELGAVQAEFAKVNGSK
jgi:photosystem II stability/assembly factor-like uncharacterized protein